MILATLVGIVALVWPSPQVQTIDEIASVPRDNTPRAEPPARPAKPVAKGAQPKAKAAAAPAPAPPAVLKKMPAPNTTTKRAGPLVQNGLEPQVPIKPDGSGVATAPPVRPPGLMQGRPQVPPRPGTGFGGMPRPAPRSSHENK